jgi:hypothetical protein
MCHRLHAGGSILSISEKLLCHEEGLFFMELVNTYYYDIEVKKNIPGDKDYASQTSAFQV